MGFKITYRPLCNVDIWHGYYLHPETLPNNTLSASTQKSIVENASLVDKYTILDDLSIAPSPMTQQLMAGHKIVFRANPSGFFLWIQAEENELGEYSPFIPFSGPIQLTFSLEVNKTSFWNFTNLTHSDIGKNLYYFSNRADNEEEDIQYLNRSGRYASSNDSVAIRPSSFSIDVSALRATEIRFVLRNDIHQTEIVRSVSEEMSFLEVCELNWDGLPSGLYELTAFDESGSEIPTLSQQVFLNTGDLPRNVFGIIEILFLPDVDFKDYALVRAIDDQELLGPTYTLWWQNRLTRWRYLFERSQSISPDPDCDVSFSDTKQNQLVTRERHPLISGHRPICFRQDNPTTEVNEEILLPNPGVRNIYPEGGDVFSEVYLGNFDLSRM